MKTETPVTIAQFIDNLIQRDPNQVISTFRDEINVFTIDELYKRANLLAKGLMYIGVGKDTKVALVLSGTTNCITFVLALSFIGAVLVPINKDSDVKITQEILKKCEVHTVGFYADHFIDKFKTIIPDYLNSERGYLKNANFPSLKNVITFGSIKNRGIFTTREIMLLGEHTDDFEIEIMSKTVMPDDLFIKQAVFDSKNKLTFHSITQGTIIKENYSLSALQNYLLNLV
ncbi:MAG TPA: AMP-binding protein [Prolixibacteraceae bacterium]|nr:AMP-binding protein [Prolixibacteraceae bacterium]